MWTMLLGVYRYMLSPWVSLCSEEGMQEAVDLCLHLLLSPSCSEVQWAEATEP